jgi:hypothetical protein
MFFLDTEVWRVVLPPKDSVKGQHGYRFETGVSDTLFVRVPAIKVGGSVIDERRYSVSEGVSLYDFDGSDDSLTLANPIVLDSNDEFEFVVNADSLASSQYAFASSDGSVFIDISSGTGVQVDFGTAATWAGVTETGTDYHLRIVRSDTTATLWINGENQGAKTVSNADVTLSLAGSGDGGQFLNGRIWGVYRNGTLLDTFSGTTDGSPSEINDQVLVSFDSPITTNDKEILMQGVLVPKTDCNSIDNNLIARWGDIIAAHAVFELKSDKGAETDPTPYYDPQGAMLARQMYLDGVGRAKSEVFLGRKSGNRHIKSYRSYWR